MSSISKIEIPVSTGSLKWDRSIRESDRVGSAMILPVPIERLVVVFASNLVLRNKVIRSQEPGDLSTDRTADASTVTRSGFDLLGLPIGL